MNLATAALIFSINLMNKTHDPSWGPYDHQTMRNVVMGVVDATTDTQFVETLIKISRWESGGFRKDVVNCKILGKLGERGAFQVYPLNEQEKIDLCSSDISKQATIALKHINSSINICKQYGLKSSNLLTIYTHGTCHAAKDNVAAARWGNGKTIQALMNIDEEKAIGNVR